MTVRTLRRKPSSHARRQVAVHRKCRGRRIACTVYMGGDTRRQFLEFDSAPAWHTFFANVRRIERRRLAAEAYRAAVRRMTDRDLLLAAGDDFDNELPF